MKTIKITAVADDGTLLDSVEVNVPNKIMELSILPVDTLGVPSLNRYEHVSLVIGAGVPSDDDES